MANQLLRIWNAACRRLPNHLNYHVALAVLPTVMLFVYWTAGETALLASAVVFPILLVLLSAKESFGYLTAIRKITARRLMTRNGFDAITEIHCKKIAKNMEHSAIFCLEIDHHETFVEMYGQRAAEDMARTAGERLASVLRAQDAVARTNAYGFSVCLEPTQHLDLELCIQLAGRLQAAVEDPLVLDGTAAYVTASVGFAQHRGAGTPSAHSWREAASIALRQAQRHGAGSVRAFTKEMRKQTAIRSELRADVTAALNNGEIKPWFQPQISTDTGRVTGFEALARWEHPTKGLIPPADFLEVIEEACLLERLAEVMVAQAFAAMVAWDKAGLDIPQVGVNFAGAELNNPNLVEKIKWELDRFELQPARLAVEILETVVAGTTDDVVTRNICKLGELGCKIDLDDFGTGNTSIASIRRFSVSRIKIDRSFVMKADRDQEQRKIISAILTLAERLDVQTLAEGVETVGEHALLAQLGCDHVQGFGIARPMPFDQTIDWVSTHNSKLVSTAQIVGNNFQ